MNKIWLCIPLLFTSLIQSSEHVVDVGFSIESELRIAGSEALIKGNSKQAKYEAFFNEYTSDEVFWTVKQATSEKTRIDDKGFLSVSVEEEAKEIEVVAISKNRPSNYKVQKVSLDDKVYTAMKANFKNQSTDTLRFPYGMNEQTLHKELQKYSQMEIGIETNDKKIYKLQANDIKYQSDDIKIDSKGIIQSGEYELKFEPVLPYLIIDYDGKIKVDYKKDTNIKGKSEVKLKIIVEGGSSLDANATTGLYGDVVTGSLATSNIYMMWGLLAVCALIALRKQVKKHGG